MDLLAHVTAVELPLGLILFGAGLACGMVVASTFFARWRSRD